MSDNINLSEERIAEYKAAFEIFDKDKDNAINDKELGTVMRNLGQNQSDEELKRIIHEVDLEENGVINLHEFIYLMTKPLNANDTEEELIEVFKIFDRDGDGYINSHELRSVLSSLCEETNPEEIEEMIKEADIDGDGKVDFQEFVKMMISK